MEESKYHNPEANLSSILATMSKLRDISYVIRDIVDFLDAVGTNSDDFIRVKGKLFDAFEVATELDVGSIENNLQNAPVPSP